MHIRNFILAGILSGCSTFDTTMQITPFPDRPDHVYNVGHKNVRFSGLIWAFDDNGHHVDFGGPLAGRLKRKEFAIFVEDANLDLTDATSVMRASHQRITDIIGASKAYCAINSFSLVSSPLHMFTEDNRAYLLQLCSPEE
jgi:hypothetical protein